MDMQVKTKYRSAKSCPRVRGKCRGVSRDERGTTQSCHAILPFPLSLTSFDSSPASGGAF